MGQRINRSDQHDHPRIHSRRTRHRRIRYRSRASKSLHGTTLEIIALPPRPCYDLGSSPLPWAFLLLIAYARDTHQGWFVSAGLICALIPGLSFLSSLAVAACLTPTDPILAAAVVGGKWADKHVPAHIRHLLAAESGCNDGAAFPFLFIALYLTLDASTGAAIRDWFLILWLCESPYTLPPKNPRTYSSHQTRSSSAPS